MKKTISRLMAVILAVVTVLSIVPMTAFAAAPAFSDVPSNAWYYKPVMYMAGDNPTGTAYMSGTGNNKFSPNLTTTRAMFVTVLGRVAEADTSKYTTSSFRDVKTGTWYAPYVEWAAANNIVSGTGNGRFSPNDYVTREQAAVILYNYLKKDYTLTVDDAFLNSAPDGSNVSPWALEAMKWATTAALMRGDNNSMLRPKYSATRAEIATIFKRFIEIKTELENNKPDVPTTCDHEWVTSETAEFTVVPAKSFTKAEWVQIPNYRTMRCNGDNLIVNQWTIDTAYADYNYATHNGNSYHTKGDVLRKLRDWALPAEDSENGDGMGCPTGSHGSGHTDTVPLTAHLLVPKTYSAGTMELPSKEKCAKCGKTRPVYHEKGSDPLMDINNWVANEESYVVCAAWDEELRCYEDSTKAWTGELLATVHHPERVNTKIVSYTNTVTGDTVPVTMTSCVHDGRKNWKYDFSSGGMSPDFTYCPDCGLTDKLENVSRETCIGFGATNMPTETINEIWARVHPDHNTPDKYYEFK